MIGIVGYGAYVPRLRLSRKAIFEANAWFAPGLKVRSKGTRAMANWDEDSITLAVAAARDCLGAGPERESIDRLLFCSTTHPFAERLNAGVVAEALRLSQTVWAHDIGGSSGCALSALPLAAGRGADGCSLLVAADIRKAKIAGVPEMLYGDAAAALLIGAQNVIAEIVAHRRHTVDFVDQFRTPESEFSYEWEERWIRDEGLSKLLPPVIDDVLVEAGLSPNMVDHIVIPTRYAKFDEKLAKQCGLNPERLAPGLNAEVGECGAASALIQLAALLPRVKPGETILVAEFSSGATGLLLRATDQIANFRPQRGVEGWLARGRTEEHYTKYLTFRDMVAVDKGMRGEQDKKTALSTLYRHRKAIHGFVAGRCRETGNVCFPPSRLSYDPQAPLLDTQEDYPLADRRGRVLSCSAEALSYYPAPPHQYGQIDFNGGGRVLMEFTDVDPGDVEAGTEMEMVFRIKDRDALRNFSRYFWKATPAIR